MLNNVFLLDFFSDGKEWKIPVSSVNIFFSLTAIWGFYLLLFQTPVNLSDMVSVSLCRHICPEWVFHNWVCSKVSGCLLSLLLFFSQKCVTPLFILSSLFSLKWSILAFLQISRLYKGQWGFFFFLQLTIWDVMDVFVTFKVVITVFIYSRVIWKFLRNFWYVGGKSDLTGSNPTQYIELFLFLFPTQYTPFIELFCKIMSL